MDAFWERSRKQSGADLAEENRRRKEDWKQWERQERVRENVARKVHLDDLRDRIMALFKARNHTVSIFHPTSAVAHQGSTSKDELYQEKTSHRWQETITCGRHGYSTKNHTI